MCGREIVFLAKFLHRIEIQLAEGLADSALLHGIGQVGRHFGDALHLAQTLVEEVLGIKIARTVFGSLLVSDESRIADGFGFNLFAVHQVAQLVQEQVEGAAVEDQVMHIGQEVNILLGGDNFHAVQRALPQVKRSYKLHFVFLQLRFA